ncbi:hypothetical protein [Methanorbis furvi]|uniref:Uncharacterized protein n=1 Tax=Methanorbis furvi TaxID=3028299 RepID=A0AAE4MCD3_9EURY|nr:hypothetical protein [Methanocorpusculaceae archaeon Ag1]
MTVNEISVQQGKLRCTDGTSVTPEKCRFCLHSRYFVIAGVAERSPALAFCLRERTTKEIDVTKASAVGCAEERGDGYASIGNIIS